MFIPKWECNYASDKRASASVNLPRLDMVGWVCPGVDRIGGWVDGRAWVYAPWKTNARENDSRLRAAGRAGGRYWTPARRACSYPLCCAIFAGYPIAWKVSALCTIPFIHCSPTFTIRYRNTTHHPLPVISRYAPPLASAPLPSFLLRIRMFLLVILFPHSRLHGVFSSSSSSSSTRFTRDRPLIWNRAESISVFCCRRVPPSNASCACLRRSDILVRMRAERKRVPVKQKNVNYQASEVVWEYEICMLYISNRLNDRVWINLANLKYTSLLVCYP